MQVERLRLAGFKSFVDATELPIEPGLTGIVGPNGCGKSNLVEALRWVMGEASARRLRGGEMDDVIFAGSANRPARNIAEVSLTIDNATRDAPIAFNDRDAIEIVRRIDRGSGSAYRVNGREARARDVQLLFADAATGAHSGGIVSQGRIGALIAAKPSDRRQLLDEAAGTAGLYQRRHEAELKLNAAEDNLLRVDDVIVTMAAQLDGLKKQARQAQRYRRLSEQIRRTEARLMEARWKEAVAEIERIAGELREAERAVAAATERAAFAERGRAGAEEALPPLRLAEASASAALHRLNHAREALDQEAQRIAVAREDAGRRREQLAGDIGREDEHVADADTALARLAEEQRMLERSESGDATARDAAATALERAAAELARAEIGLQQMTEACATGEARRVALERRRGELAEQRRRLSLRLEESETQRRSLGEVGVPQTAIDAAAADVAAAAAQAEADRAAANDVAERLTAARAAEAAAIDAARDAERRLARLKAEADALTSILAPGPSQTSGDRPAVLSLLDVPAGLEAAVAALFDDELAAPLLDSPGGTASGWMVLPPLTKMAALPTGAEPLAKAIGAPPALARRLSQTGLVAGEAEGWALQASLAPGQRIVDRDGRLWRWDGFVRLAAGDRGAAEQLRQRNRLAVVAAEIVKAETEAQASEATATAARARASEAAAAEREITAAARRAEDALGQKRAAEAELSRRALATEARLAALADTTEKLAAELKDVDGQAAETERGLALLPDPGLARAGLDGARTQAAAARRHESEAQAAIARLTQESESRRRRIAAIGAESQSWQQRRERALAQRGALGERQTALAAEIAALAARPAQIAAEIKALREQSANAAATHRAAADALALGETRLREANDTARQTEQALSAAREARVRCEVRRDAAGTALDRLRDDIRDRLATLPEALAELTEGEDAADPAQLDSRLDRLSREREAIGPVNLVAEREAEEVEARVESLQQERNELTEAIARLRRGIATLDQESRKRLQGAFETLNGHFATLFQRLFGGGRAHLTLTDADDPLDAGLEIMASPPGKRLQSLSLLSGGEQALTAIALIFAVFLTNPAPICVLDEVDAPLDDANVDRFCELVAEIADATGTKFLLITHHRITMAHMDRLFGVTMPERGVSQLVSVDLARAAELRAPAFAAAQ
ncbi:MAG TPA: chromosome segregation protein SMC [Stellaceae bacterium]|jgi:chromosome segregation protein|nr:chromosome segregation protein SMC [Stellaceae bacterium]